MSKSVEVQGCSCLLGVLELVQRYIRSLQLRINMHVGRSAPGRLAKRVASNKHLLQLALERVHFR